MLRIGLAKLESTVAPSTVAPDIAAGLARAEKLVDREAIYDGPRCYSAVGYWLGMLGGPIDIAPRFATLWLQSPLMQPIDGSALRPGDVIAVMDAKGEPTTHVAVVDKDGAFFQKGGSPASFPFERVSLAELKATYPDQPIKFFRPIAVLQGATADALSGLEARIAKYLVPETSEHDDAWYDEFAAVNQDVREKAAAIAEQLEGKTDWQSALLRERAEALRYQPDPYE